MFASNKEKVCNAYISSFKRVVWGQIFGSIGNENLKRICDNNGFSVVNVGCGTGIGAAWRGSEGSGTAQEEKQVFTS